MTRRVRAPFADCEGKLSVTEYTTVVIVALDARTVASLMSPFAV